MSRPVLLDVYCGAGGAARGYQDAGFYVVGVDKEPQPNYCGDDFIQADALEVLESLPLKRLVQAVHTSPPCQASCALIKGNQKATAGNHVDLIPQTRMRLESLGVPTVIENVQGAQIRRDLTLCGEMFGLGVIRHRYFECNFPVVQPAHVKHRGRVRGWRHGEYHDGPYVAVYGDGGGKGSIEEWQQAMGVPWMQTRHEIAESIPPSYAAYVGWQLLQALEKAA